MASSGKKKTTMAKLMRESRVRERRLAKKVKKDARQHMPLVAVDQIVIEPVDGLEPEPVDDQAVDDAGVSPAS